MTKRWFWLLVLLLIGLRGWYAIRVAPSSLNQDEAAILMNARFVAETGRDEWQQSWPVVFRSFGDAKLPGYIYTVMALGKVIGWSAVATRLPSWLAGVGLVFLAYWWGKQLGNNEVAGRWAAVLLLLSPWSWHYSSIGYEAHLGLFFFVLAAAVVWRSTTWRGDAAAAVLLLISMLTYNAPLLIAPWLLLMLAGRRSWRVGLRGGAWIVAAVVLAAALTLRASAQKGGIAIFQDPTVLAAYPAFRWQFTGIGQRLLGNKIVYFALQMIINWEQSFSWDFLVQRGGQNPWHAIPLTGHVNFVVWLALPLAIGQIGRQCWLSLRQSAASHYRGLVMMSGLVMALLPAVITVDAPHATRSLFFFFWLTVIAAVGIAGWWSWRRCWVAVGMLVVVLSSWLVWYLPTPQRWQTAASARWQIGLMAQLQSNQVQQASSVTIADDNGTLYPYAVLASGLSPSTFWATVHRSAPDTVGLVKVERVGKFTFGNGYDQNSAVYVYPVAAQQWDTIRER